MKRFFKIFIKNPMLIIFLIIMIGFMPTALFSPGENKNRAIITAIGIDKIDQEYEISLLTFIPTPNPTYLETSSVISAKGETVVDALYKAQISIGKRIGLSHAKTTVVGEEMLDEDIAPSVDYLSRIASLSENTIFISTNGTAREFLQASQSLVKDLGLKLDQLISYDVKSVYVTDTTLESFYKGYFSQVKSSLIGYLNLEEEGKETITSMDSGESSSGGTNSGGSGNEGGNSGGNGEGNAGNSSGSSGEGSSGQSSASGKKKIVNNGDAILVKNGKKVKLLSEDIIQGINIINPKAIGQKIRIMNITNDEIEDANLTYIVRKKNIKKSLKLENGNPILAVEAVLGLELVEIEGEKDDLKLNSEYTLLTKEISDKIEKYCKQEFTKALKVLRANKTDILAITQKILSSGHKYKEFYDNLEDKEDILNHVNFQLTVKCKSE